MRLRGLSVLDVHLELKKLFDSGRMVQLQQAAQEVITHNPDVLQDNRYPSPFQYLGVAQYALGDLAKATETFEEAVRTNENDVMSWVHLGNCYLYLMELTKAATVLEIAVLQKGAVRDVHRLFKARNWMADWQDRDELMAQVELVVADDLLHKRLCVVNPLDFAELPSAQILGLSRQPLIAGGGAVTTANKYNHTNDDWMLHTSELRVGFVSSDLGIHPVSTLIRGMLAMLKGEKTTHRIKVYCFSLTTATSWWKRNITQNVDYMISLTGKDPSEAASIIHSHGIHVLLDLNGHTVHSGLPIFRYSPALVQISFLGYPMTTGVSEIDYVITDAVATPVETSSEFFNEKMLVLPTHYIVNDHLQMLGHTLDGTRPPLSSATRLDPPYHDDVFVFATFSNWQKMDPPIFSAWMAILARVPSSVLWFLRYSGHDDAESHLRQEAYAHGIDGARLVFSDLEPWINHTYSKRAADLILDTSLKNGHTTMIDALCAGVPVLTLEGSRMSNRASASALHSLDLRSVLTVNSYKEYVDLAVQLATDLPLLTQLRETVEARRLQYPLFDTSRYTKRFSSAIQSAWQMRKSQQRNHDDAPAFHIFPPLRSDNRVSPREIRVFSALSANDGFDNNSVGDLPTRGWDESRVQAMLSTQTPIQLHIGGRIQRPGWWIVDAADRDHVDFVMHMDNLHAFPDDSVEVVYASHILEHCHYGVDNDVDRTLREWHRVLKPGGTLFVAVPDLAALSSLFVNETISEQDRFFVMRMMFGGQLDVYDVHKTGFNAAFLSTFLTNAGYCEVERVRGFNLFEDSSEVEFRGVPISLNMKAQACKSNQRS
ncbi:hypothetical protein Poli38472_008424 [Pythium oligandrum]|uniref:protein O-GlcNAc transferase n=1 Tax=Pythium oligandrum TaxID=41045 RepID=A0A8K1CLN4_PYTOL|nr:hypothetical protein Poli38472_008424 [Pythium oligandrum]|eukprot:TMW65782.1 hypothetical protein Poli38472_008424 [Pythium oligandrum]